MPTVLSISLTANTGIVEVPIDITGFTYSSISKSIGSEEPTATDVSFNNDGTKMYVMGIGNGQIIYQYSLSTEWDVSTASYDSVSFDVGSEEGVPFGMFFGDSGSKLYVVGNSQDTVFQYSLSSAYDLSTVSYDSVSFGVSGQDNIITDVFFSTDGTKMYVTGNNNMFVFQYTLSSAWDLSTANYDSVSFDLTSQVSSVTDMFISSDGETMIVLDNVSDAVFQYSLSTAWDIGSATYDGVSISVSGQESNAQGLTFSDDGTIMYVVGTGSDTVYQYS